MIWNLQLDEVLVGTEDGDPLKEDELDELDKV